ncbi:MAG: 7,8-dihydroneopterin aldolase/epimerase/oxygenase [Verrucomicrobiota bacterium]
MIPEAGFTIHVEQLELMAHIGVPDEERARPQRLTINMTLWPIREGGLNDDIRHTVDYSTACEETKKFVETRQDKLIETLADALANHLLEVFEIQRIAVELRKFILPDVEFVSVTLTREK